MADVRQVERLFVVGEHQRKSPVCQIAASLSLLGNGGVNGQGHADEDFLALYLSLRENEKVGS